MSPTFGRRRSCLCWLLPIVYIGLVICLANWINRERSGGGGGKNWLHAGEGGGVLLKPVAYHDDGYRGPNRDLMDKSEEERTTFRSSPPPPPQVNINRDAEDEEREVQSVLDADVVPSEKRRQLMEKRRLEFRRRFMSPGGKKRKDNEHPILPSIFNFNSLSARGKDNPVVFALAVASERLQRELSGEDMDTMQSEVTSNTVSANPLSDGEAPLHTLLLGNATLAVGAALPLEAVRPVLIAATWRSGSSFLGDLLTHYPGTFYSFEPLHYTDKDRRATLAPLPLLKSLYRCQFDNGYLRHASRYNFLFLKHNHRLARVCRNLLPNSAACFLPRMAENSCKMYPVRLVKTVRLRVRKTEELLRDLPNLKVVALFRDPRGMMASRAEMEWCDQDKCANPKFVCRDMESDVAAAFDLRNRYPGRVHIVRYEDLALSPKEEVGQMLDFLELPPSKAVDKFVYSHTRIEEEESNNNVTAGKDPYGTVRDSAAAAFAWRDRVDMGYIVRIQEACRRPMDKLGYNMLVRQEERDDSLTFPAMTRELPETQQQP